MRHSDNRDPDPNLEKPYPDPYKTHLGWAPLDWELGPAVAGVLVIYHIAGQTKVRNLRIARI